MPGLFLHNGKIRVWERDSLPGIDYVNNDYINVRADVVRGRWSLSVLALALLFSLAPWSILGLAVWRALAGWH
jgi:hypothetical protein